MDKDTARDEEPSAPQVTAKEKEDDIEFNGFDPDKKKPEVDQIQEIQEDQEDEKMDLSYQPLQSRSNGRKKFVITAAAIAALLIGGWAVKGIFSGSNKTEIKTESQPIPTSAPVTPAPTPKPALVRSEWSFEVLNGSGVSGEAKKLAEELRKLGYEVLKTANADKDTYTQNQIFVRAGLKEKIDPVIADLKDIIKIASVAGELTDSSASARIIIGRE